MEIFYTRADIGLYLNSKRTGGSTIGFVPTMGALHDGHLSLISMAGEKTDIVVCSIFVNPTQFNDPRDLENYPRPENSDIDQLKLSGCSALFMPSVEEMYNKDEHWNIDLEHLDKILEGEIRPGHYQGVTQIVKKLFDTIQPDYAFFGQKDFQQFMVISYMVKKLNIPVKLILCPIIREKSGLAMSSRNIYLSDTQKKDALALHNALLQAKGEFREYALPEIKERITQILEESPGIELEYFELADVDSLELLTSADDRKIIALVAARIGKIRIIDNMILN